jgi:hypothetical protein
METDPSVAVLGELLKVDERGPSLSEWIREKPIRRSRLLLWMVQHTDTHDGMDEIVTALVAAVKLSSLPQGPTIRALLEDAISVWDIAHGKVPGRRS